MDEAEMAPLLETLMKPKSKSKWREVIWSELGGSLQLEWPVVHFAFSFAVNDWSFN